MKYDEKRKRQKDKKQDLSESSSSDSDPSDNSDYICKRRKNKTSHSEKWPYQIMREANAKDSDDSV